MDDAVTRYRAASEAGDIDGVMATLAPDADHRTRVITGDATVGPFKLGDAMVLELADDGRIRRIRPHLRSWLAVTLLALKLGPKMGRHPGLVRRALRRG